MASISHIFSYIRLLLSKRFNAFTCCAACGVLPCPVANRLCISLSLAWPVDIVMLGGLDRPGPGPNLADLRAAMPWARRIFVPAAEAGHFGPEAAILPEGMEMSRLPQVADLAEHFIVLRGRLPGRLLTPLDFFTPNGLPLLFVRADCAQPCFAGVAAGMCKTAAALFAEAVAGDPSLSGPEGYMASWARWAYTNQRGIPVPGHFPEDG